MSGCVRVSPVAPYLEHELEVWQPVDAKAAAERGGYLVPMGEHGQCATRATTAHLTPLR